MLVFALRGAGCGLTEIYISMPCEHSKKQVDYEFAKSVFCYGLRVTGCGFWV